MYRLSTLAIAVLVTLPMTSQALEESPEKTGPPFAVQSEQPQGLVKRGPRSGLDVAAGLNVRFFDTRATCEGNTPSYYCSGVTLRGTEDGSWNPWDPSDGAIRKGSQSFSWIRADAKVTHLWRLSGYILLAQADALSQGKPVEYLCAYPHDAYTDLAGRPGLGCGLQTPSNGELIKLLSDNPELANLLRNNPAVTDRLKHNQDPADLLKNNQRLAQLLEATPAIARLLEENRKEVEQWTLAENKHRLEQSGTGARLADLSTCAGKNAVTPAGWNAYTSTLTQRYYQCSLSTEDAAQFDTSLKVRGYSMPPAIHSDYNELLIKVWPASDGSQLPLEAFYYQGSGSQDQYDAMRYQSKYYRATGKWVPIISINPTAGMGKAFFYHKEDQMIPEPDPGQMNTNSQNIETWQGRNPAGDDETSPAAASLKASVLDIHESASPSVVDIKTASVGAGDEALVTSLPQTVKVKDSSPVGQYAPPALPKGVEMHLSGEQIAADLNARYNSTYIICDNNGLPAYYCNGVALRGTNNGDFDPWDPSDTQKTKGSVSFSYIRKDSYVTLLARNSGYVFLSGQEAITQGKQQDYLCIYVHDAWTDLVGRPASGCGFQPGANQALIDLLTSKPEWVELLRKNEAVTERLRNNQDPASLLKNDPEMAAALQSAPMLGPLLAENERMLEQWSKESNPADDDVSTCTSVNAAYSLDWLTYARQLTHPSQQCSLSTLDARQFADSLIVRQQPMPAMYSTYNELLIKVWPTGIAAQLPLQAFYYQNPAGLAEAKIYQRKFATKTGGTWLPVIKLDTTQWSGNPFSYNPADQALQP